MNILVLHRVPYARIQYHRGIDHTAHNVTYLGVQAIIDTLPADLNCTRVVRPGLSSAFDEAYAWLIQGPMCFDRIISMSEYELLDAARLREAFGVPGPSVRQVSLVRNKLLMKDTVAASGLRVPRFLSLDAFMQRPDACPWSGKTVIKPHSGASSVDVQVHDSVALAAQAVSQRMDNGALQLEAFEVEEFIDGPVRHFDGLVQHGRIYEMTSSEYVGTCLAYMEHGEPLGSFQMETTPAMREWVGKVLAAVEIRDGAFHLEAIMDGDNPVFLEVGHRVGGADVVATFEMATGIHLPSLELRIHLHTYPIEPREPSNASQDCFGWFAFPGHAHPAATFSGLSGATAFRDNSAIVQWHELPIGAALPRHVTYSAHEAPLTGIVKLENPNQAKAWLRNLFDGVALCPATEAVA